MKEKGKITNSEYQALNDTTKKTASRDLSDLTSKGIFEREGITGKGTEYLLLHQRGQRRHKGDIKGT